ncbi:MAG: hypothetical protein F6K50_05800 [Moorea sp. SIO3I7]|uniref:hypothetical protein n=1 Tax=unclassified Moorena TaxID=2683338 RepID=UPI0013BF087A|nr:MULTISPECIES: hypothetical protein [unclassified Moorena]NEN95058.1 hypothetical protein [Moorena sp. SIO3I7]NEO05288.1 hypothetical protein [Moorena sp. SIO3I8]NEO19193.1 hypothetical protein [Moorena sp. SIO4A5]NEQ57821.1 hypothetical protein [Moorena sp. SIO4A1]
MVHKKTDPRYALLRGHIPKHLLKRFRNYCVEHELDYSEGLEDALTKFFNYLDSSQLSAVPAQTPTIADLIHGWNLEELSRLSEVSVENLQAIMEGNRPTDDDLIGLGVVLCKNNGEPWTTDELVEIRDRCFYGVPKLSSNSESPRIQ